MATTSGEGKSLSEVTSSQIKTPPYTMKGAAIQRKSTFKETVKKSVPKTYKEIGVTSDVMKETKKIMSADIVNGTVPSKQTTSNKPRRTRYFKRVTNKQVEGSEVSKNRVGDDIGRIVTELKAFPLDEEPNADTSDQWDSWPEFKVPKRRVSDDIGSILTELKSFSQNEPNADTGNKCDSWLEDREDTRKFVKNKHVPGHKVFKSRGDNAASILTELKSFSQNEPNADIGSKCDSWLEDREDTRKLVKKKHMSGHKVSKSRGGDVESIVTELKAFSPNADTHGKWDSWPELKVSESKERDNVCNTLIELKASSPNKTKANTHGKRHYRPDTKDIWKKGNKHIPDRQISKIRVDNNISRTLTELKAFSPRTDTRGEWDSWPELKTSKNRGRDDVGSALIELKALSRNVLNADTRSKCHFLPEDNGDTCKMAKNKHVQGRKISKSRVGDNIDSNSKELKSFSLNENNADICGKLESWPKDSGDTCKMVKNKFVPGRKISKSRVGDNVDSTSKELKAFSVNENNADTHSKWGFSSEDSKDTWKMVKNNHVSGPETSKSTVEDNVGSNLTEFKTFPLNGPNADIHGEWDSWPEVSKDTCKIVKNKPVSGPEDSKSTVEDNIGCNLTELKAPSLNEPISYIRGEWDSSPEDSKDTCKMVKNEHVPGREVSKIKVGDNVGSKSTELKAFSLNEPNAYTRGEWDSSPVDSKDTWKMMKDKHVPDREVSKNKVGDIAGGTSTGLKAFSLNVPNADTCGEWDSLPEVSKDTWKMKNKYRPDHEVSNGRVGDSVRTTLTELKAFSFNVPNADTRGEWDSSPEDSEDTLKVVKNKHVPDCEVSKSGVGDNVGSIVTEFKAFSLNADTRGEWDSSPEDSEDTTCKMVKDKYVLRHEVSQSGIGDDVCTTLPKFKTFSLNVPNADTRGEWDSSPEDSEDTCKMVEDKHELGREVSKSSISDDVSTTLSELKAFSTNEPNPDTRGEWDISPEDNEDNWKLVKNKHVPGHEGSKKKVGDDVGSSIVTELKAISLNEPNADSGEWDSCTEETEFTWTMVKDKGRKRYKPLRQEPMTLQEPKTLQDLLLVVENDPKRIPLEDDLLEQLCFTKKDIDRLPRITPNITSGPVGSIQDYVRVQYNLLLFDFIRPLKDGIEILKSSMSLKRKQALTQLKVFENAKFSQYDIKRNKFGIIVKFNQNTFSHRSDFFDGSLLIFSKDNFKHYFFATVIDYSSKGKVTVKLFEDSIQDLMSSEYTMVESEIFFQPYFHVLQALRRLTEENFPMKRYIIDVHCDITPPEYLKGKRIKFFFEEGECKDVPAMDPEVWPDAQELGMDASQYLAFRSALIQEFAVIQGPPGTGKTYLGLQVAKVLINNADIWNNDHRPILVVCFTNHALDQFLEGLVTLTTELIRVGGQSKSRALQPYNLRDKKRDFRLFGYGSVRKYIAGEMEVSAGIMQMIENDLTLIKSNVGVIPLNYFKQREIINDKHARCFDIIETNLILHETKNKNIVMESTFLRWLFNSTDAADFYKSKEISESCDNEVMENIELVFEHISVSNSITVLELETKIIDIEQNMRVINISNKQPYQKHSMMWSLEEGHVSYSRALVMLKEFLSFKTRSNRKQIERLSIETDLWQLNLHERWALYRYWVDQANNSLKKMRAYRMRELQDGEKNYEIARILDDVDVLQSSLIVGMTTTGAAKNQPLLQKLKPRIVIVEEAAEVLESHIIASLTPFCEHLILIGDHQQLRPNINVHRLRCRYGFDISLFERMVENHLPSDVLKVQHRMRPEIACLIHPAIYANLENHPDVYKYPDVMGITTNMFFIDHTVPEEKNTENKSHWNIHEAGFLMRLCRYIVMQGYATSQVTILSMYKAQVAQLIKERSKCDMVYDVRISTVDDYQGEENTVILLSLVRSNKDSSIGFLRTKNRICVALSRAREGLYIIGNMENMTQSCAAIWIDIQHTLIQQRALGDSLTLRCQRHPRVLTVVRAAKDFVDVSEGGCSRQCEIPLTCSHPCTFKCHILDAEHKDRYRCLSECERAICKEGHTCKKKCWMECELKCTQLILRNFDPCGHKALLPCCKDYSQCTQRCMKPLPCGHNCQELCHFKEMEVPCSQDIVVDGAGEILDTMNMDWLGLNVQWAQDRGSEGMGENLGAVSNNWPDPSVKWLQGTNIEGVGENFGAMSNNWLDPNVQSNVQWLQGTNSEGVGENLGAVCNNWLDPSVQWLQYRNSEGMGENLGAVSKDGQHGDGLKLNVQRKCGKCLVAVKKKYPNCDHYGVVPCNMDMSYIRCKEPCTRKLMCGHTCKGICGNYCIACDEKVEKRNRCGHMVVVGCRDNSSLASCGQKCEKKLPCGHKCTNLCGEPCTTECYELSNSKMGICGHTIQIPCSKSKLIREDCEDLLSKCQTECGMYLGCGHKCQGKCSDCLQGRIHKQCSEPCSKILICGHSCSAQCYLSCPPCTQHYKYKCTHSQQQKACFKPLQMCMEDCEWRCKHHWCTKKCSEPCSRKPCKKACGKQLSCGHACMGYCSDDCPPICRQCRPDKVINITGPWNLSSRCIYLVDCGHTIECEKMTLRMGERDDEVRMKTCPVCQTAIVNTLRYRNEVKSYFRYECAVKAKICKQLSDADNKKQKILSTLYELKPKVDNGKFEEVIKSITERCLKNFKSNGELFGLQTNILSELAQLFTQITTCQKSVKKKKTEVYFEVILAALANRPVYLSEQELDDFRVELRRFGHIVQLCKAKDVISAEGLDETLFNKRFDMAIRPTRYLWESERMICEFLQNVNRTLKMPEEEANIKQISLVKIKGVCEGQWKKSDVELGNNDGILNLQKKKAPKKKRIKSVARRV